MNYNENLICLRSETGDNIGLGHFFRTLNLYYEFERRNCDVVFIINKNLYVQNYLDAKLINYELIDTEVTSSLIEKFNKYKNRTVIFDCKAYLDKELELFKSFDFKNVLLDRLLDNDQFVDLTILPNPYSAIDIPNYSFYKSKIVFGAQYYSLRESFRKISQNSSLDFKNSSILISFGASDPNDLTSQILQALIEISFHKKIIVVLGPYYKHKAKIENLSINFEKRIEIVENTDNIETYMKDSYIAFTALGTTVYELNYLGIPTAVICNYTEDIKRCEYLHNIESIHFLGHYTALNNNLKNKIEKIIFNFDHLNRLFDNGKQLIDGNGSKRIVDLIIDKKFEWNTNA